MAMNRPAQKIESENKTAKRSLVWWSLGAGLIVAVATIAGVVSFIAGTIPKVERMLASEKVALESGKKTRAEVAEAAMKLAADADDEAAKLLLMKGAFILHVKDGDLEKAVKTMNALETTIADMPPQIITNIIETALLGLPNKTANGARLYRLLDEAKVSAKSAVVEGKSLKAVVGGHTWSYTIRNGGASIEAPGGKYECAVSPIPEGSIVIPAKLGGVSVTRIGRAAFTRCHALTDVTIPPTVTSIGMSAFYECRMKSVTIPPAVKEIGELAFYNSSLKSVTIPEGVTSIGGGAFGDCWSLESVSIPSSVTSIGKSAVASGSNRMKSIVVSPDNPKYAVYGDLLCTKDGKTVLGSVGGEVKIPDGVTCIAEGAFYKCYGLTSVVIPSSVVEIGDSAFEWCDDIYSFDVSPENRVFASPNGLLCTKDGKTVIAGVNGDIVIPEGVTRIGDSAFTGRRGLTSVTIPSSVKSLGSEVFRCCKGLESVTIRGEKPNAQKGLFDYCDKLKAVHVPVNGKSWSGMKNWFGIRLVFDGCLQRQEEQAVKDAERQAQAERERAQREAERAEQREQLRMIHEEWARVRAAKAAAEKGKSAASCATNKPATEKSSVAEKLGQCDFLLNKDFKKNAKVYLCLFSASWCGPCRREMPRIAKTYAETLKDDPNIELIHFSRDQNDEKAMAWAKEHDVQFPVVKPNGGNPLDLHCNGIPHLFIVKADGTLLEEGHPMRIFNEEKFKELKDGRIGGDAKSSCSNNEATALPGDIPYGIRMEPAPGCEKGAEYVLRRLRDAYLPAALRYYGDPFNGKKATRVFTVVVKRNDGSDGRNYTGPSWGSCGDGVDRFTIGLSKGSDKWEMDITLLASKILTVCREDDGAALHIYANKFVDGAVRGVDPIPALKEDIRQGIEKAGDGSEKNGRIGVLCKLAPMWSVFEELRKKHPTFLLDYHNLKNSRFACGKLPEQVSLSQMVGLLAEVTGENVLELCKKYGIKGAGKNSIAEKLGTGDFFLNKDFKNEAKYYFYLLSDYWRPEMPRIAKTYAEMLKDDPDIELIHVLYGRDYEKALAWAKGHDVKFPIVKDNPLRLYWRTSGDYMFIVNADGSVLKEGKPKILFTEEKLRRLKNGEPLSNVATINGVKWTYEIVDGEVVLGEGTTRNGLAVPKDTVGSILIPDSIEGRPVRCIDEYAFSGCKGLTSITIPSSVTKIKGCAFEGCNGLTSLTIPSGVKEVDPSAFSDCGNLKFISVSADNGQYASSGDVLFDRSLQRLVRCPCGFRGVYIVPDGVTLIGRSAFSAWSSGCSGLSGIKIPDSVKSIGDYSFDFCKSLKEVILGNGVTTIGSCAFRCCDGLTSIKIPKSVVNIDHYAFGACRSLASVTMCGERPKADTGVFKDCKKLTAIHVPANAKSWAGMKEWQGIPLVFDAEAK